MLDNEVRHGPSTVDAGTVPDSLADITERLMGEFGDTLDLSVISRTVLHCRNALTGTASGARPTQVEDLARQRLRGMLLGTLRPAVPAPRHPN